jgi:1-acyl-sn-glycerol-3-phosphate acyltransferase
MIPPTKVEIPAAHRRNAVWRTFQRICQNIFAFWLEYRARGIEDIPPGPALLIANHQSFLDPLLIGLPLQRRSASSRGIRSSKSP